MFIRDEDSFFEAFVHELEKVDGLMEEIQMLSQAERNRITRKNSVAEDDLDVNEKVERVLDALQGKDELEKSKVAKVYKEKSGLLTLTRTATGCPAETTQRASNAVWSSCPPSTRRQGRG